MIKSMTGYGRGVSLSEIGTFTIELKSVNHRFRDISLKLPQRLAFLEKDIKGKVEKIISRGKVDIHCTYSMDDECENYFDVNIPLARQYMAALQKLKEELSIEGTPTLTDIASIKDIIGIKESPADEKVLRENVLKPLGDALTSLCEMRATEGENLASDIRARLSKIEETAEKIMVKQPDLIGVYSEKLKQRIAKLTDGVEIDESRLAQEIAIISDKSDITEEIVRLKSHISQFDGILASEEPVGRKLDFLIQEINREVNTIGSKSNEAEISRNVVDIKAEIEKIREQVQNIE